MYNTYIYKNNVYNTNIQAFKITTSPEPQKIQRLTASFKTRRHLRLIFGERTLPHSRRAGR